LTSKLSSYDKRLEDISNQFRSLSFPPSEKTLTSAESTSCLSQISVVATSVEQDGDIMTDFEKESPQINEAMLEDKKKWEEVCLARDEQSVEDSIVESGLNAFFHADSLLTQSLSPDSTSPLDSLSEMSVASLYAEVDSLLRALQPHESQQEYRNQAASFIAKQVRVSLNALSFDCGMHALSCSLPTDPVRFSLPLTQQQLTHWHTSLAERLKLVAEGHVQTPRSLDPLVIHSNSELDKNDLTDVFQRSLRNLLVIVDNTVYGQLGTATNTKVSGMPPNSNMIVQFQMDAIECSVSSNQRFELCNLAFLEEFAVLVGRDHLFKRSLLLIRSWWEYESSSYAGVVMKGTLSETALAFLLVTIFNNFHVVIEHPLQALVHFLREFSLYDGSTQAITMQGVVPFVDGSSGNDNVPCLVRPQQHQLVSQDLLEKYWQMLFVHDSAAALSANTSPGGVFVANVSWPTQSSTALSPSQLLKQRQAMLQSMQRSLSRFEKTNAFNVVHPFAFCNLVVDKSAGQSAVSQVPPVQQNNRMALISKVFQLSYHTILSVFESCKQQSNSTVSELLRRFLPSVYPRLASPFRPDAINNSILVGNTGMEFTNDANYRDLMSSSVEKLCESVAYSNFISENVLSESAILTFCADTLSVKGPLPAGELGKLLSEASTIANLSHKLRERFGGLKKFLERFPEKFIFSNDHPFNPHVLLRSAISAENLELIDRGIFPIHLISKSARAAAAAQAAKKSAKPAGVASSSPQQQSAPSPAAGYMADFASSSSPSPGHYYKPSPTMPSASMNGPPIGNKAPIGGYYQHLQQLQGRGSLHSGHFNNMSDPFGPPPMLLNKAPQYGTNMPSAASHSAARLRGEYFAPKGTTPASTTGHPTRFNNNFSYGSNAGMNNMQNPAANSGNGQNGEDFYFNKLSGLSTGHSNPVSTNNDPFAESQRKSFMHNGEDQQLFMSDFGSQSSNNSTFSNFRFGQY
jgi:hypothetical protein